MPSDPTPLGQYAPDFHVRASNNPRFAFQSLGGIYVALLFYGSAADPAARVALDMALARPGLFDDRKATCFGVSIDPADEELPRVRQRIPGFRLFWDFDGQVSRLYGALPPPDAPRMAPAMAPVAAPAALPGTAVAPTGFRGFWLVLDPMLRVLMRQPLDATERVLDWLASLPPPDAHAGTPLSAPVLILPRVFEPDFCQELIAAYEAGQTFDSGFMREIDGRTVGILDSSFKRRRDCEIDGALRDGARRRIETRLLPAIRRAFMFRATRMERYIVGCYDSGSGGYFRPHRDNTTKGTAHRRFAVTLNLNAEEYVGGDLRFPEFGQRTYRAPTGGGRGLFMRPAA